MPWRPRPHELGWLAIAAALANAVLLYALVRCLGDLTMKRLPMLAILALAAVTLAGCITPSFTDYAKAANTLDPGCYKDVQIQAVPVLVFGWPIPVVSGTYRKVCNAEQAGGSLLGRSVGPSAPIRSPL